MALQPILFITVFLSAIIGLSGIGYATWILFLFPKYIFPLFKLNKVQAKNWQKSLWFVLPAFGWLACRIAAPLVLSYVVSAVTAHSSPSANQYSLFLFIGASIFLGLTALPYGVFQLILKGTKNAKQFKKIDMALAGLTAVSFVLGGAFLLNMFLTNYHSPQGEQFFVLNAAIKNTCFMDPKKIGCPHNLTELSYLEPAQFAIADKNTQMVYQYYPDQNLYTFIVRYSRTQAVIFDWRLVNENNGIDFKEVKVDTTGVDHIKNPPNFPGPWDNLPEWNK